MAAHVIDGKAIAAESARELAVLADGTQVARTPHEKV